MVARNSSDLHHASNFLGERSLKEKHRVKNSVSTSVHSQINPLTKTLGQVSQALCQKQGFPAPALALRLRLQLSHCLTWDKLQDTQISGTAKRNMGTLLNWAWVFSLGLMLPLLLSCLHLLFHLNCHCSDFCQMKVEMSASPRADTEIFKRLGTCTGLFWHSTEDQHSEKSGCSPGWLHTLPIDQWEVCSWSWSYSIHQRTFFPVWSMQSNRAMISKQC